MACCRYFNPRFPQGKRPFLSSLILFPVVFQSTLPAREATGAYGPYFLFYLISIHASRKGSDNPDIALNPDNVISIHASRKGSDVLRRQHHSRNRRFQSTLPAREATLEEISQIASDFDFNPRFPQGKRHFSKSAGSRLTTFQSTLPAREATLQHPLQPLEARDFNPRFPQGKRQYRSWYVGMDKRFQSTLPAREATFHFLGRGSYF